MTAAPADVPYAHMDVLAANYSRLTVIAYTAEVGASGRCRLDVLAGWTGRIGSLLLGSKVDERRTWS
jgi:hypothetical protein